MQEEGSAFMKWLDDQSLEMREKIRVEIVGVGAKAVCRTFPAMLEKVQPQWVLAAGFAGSLTNDLKVGEVYFARNFSSFAVSDQSLSGKILCSTTSIANSVAERVQVMNQSGAEMVDMESETLAQIAQQQAVPIFILKVISDTAAQPIPIPFAMTYHLEDQRIRICNALFWLAIHPQKWWSFGIFLRDLRRNRRRLGEAVVQCLSLNG